MRILLKLLLTGLLLVLVVAVGAEVVALHRSPIPNPMQSEGPPVVVRKATNALAPPKSVRPLPAQPPAPPASHKHIMHKRAPAS